VFNSAGGASSVIDASGLFETAGAETVDGTGHSATAFPSSVGASVSDAGAFVLAETALNMHCWGRNPVVVAKLQLNGQDRFSEREGTYFDQVQPFQHHTRHPSTGINVYSFGLRPEEHQPSGTCNFSRIDNATLQLTLSNAAVSGTNTAKVRVYATNYNVLRIMSGMGGLAYSN
jgi:Large eukaryotic DNA virus major capsid protein.